MHVNKNPAYQRLVVPLCQSGAPKPRHEIKNFSNDSRNKPISVRRSFKQIFLSVKQHNLCLSESFLFSQMSHVRSLVKQHCVCLSTSSNHLILIQTRATRSHCGTRCLHWFMMHSLKTGGHIVNMEVKYILYKPNPVSRWGKWNVY